MKYFVIIGILLVSGCSQVDAVKKVSTTIKREAGIELYERVCDLTYGTEKHVISTKDLSRDNFSDFCKLSEKR